MRVMMLVAALAAAPIPPVQAMTVPSPYTASFETVPQITCADKRGTGVRIGDSLMITATHVSKGSECSALGKTLSTLRNEPGVDVSFVNGSFGDGFRAIVSCDGIHEGEHYLALGYADGGAPDVEVLIGTKQKTFNGQVWMSGHVYHGMSGGAVLNQQGALVAVINAMNAEGRPIAFVTPLTNTYLCKGSNA